MVNVTIYGIHGSYGIWMDGSTPIKIWQFLQVSTRCRPPTAINRQSLGQLRSRQSLGTPGPAGDHWRFQKGGYGWKKSTTNMILNGFHGNISEDRLKNQPITSRISLIWYIKKIFQSSGYQWKFYPARTGSYWIIPMGWISWVIHWILIGTSKNIHTEAFRDLSLQPRNVHIKNATHGAGMLMLTKMGFFLMGSMAHHFSSSTMGQAYVHIKNPPYRIGQDRFTAPGDASMHFRCSPSFK